MDDVLKLDVHRKEDISLIVGPLVVTPLIALSEALVALKTDHSRVSVCELSASSESEMIGFDQSPQMLVQSIQRSVAKFLLREFFSEGEDKKSPRPTSTFKPADYRPELGHTDCSDESEDNKWWVATKLADLWWQVKVSGVKRRLGFVCTD